MSYIVRAQQQIQSQNKGNWTFSSSPVVSSGYTSKCSGPYWSNPSFLKFFWHSGTLALRTERQSARMSKNYKGWVRQYGAERFSRLIFAIIRKIVVLKGLNSTHYANAKFIPATERDEGERITGIESQIQRGDSGMYIIRRTGSVTLTTTTTEVANHRLDMQFTALTRDLWPLTSTAALAMFSTVALICFQCTMLSMHEVHFHGQKCFSFFSFNELQAAMKIRKLEKFAIKLTMHCHLRPPDAMPLLTLKLFEASGRQRRYWPDYLYTPAELPQNFDISASSFVGQP